MIGVFRPRPTAFVHDWFTVNGGRQVADSKAENKTTYGSVRCSGALGDGGRDLRFKDRRIVVFRLIYARPDRMARPHQPCRAASKCSRPVQGSAASRYGFATPIHCPLGLSL